MLKYFRHIRQRMIKENRVSKYVLYAIGEIMLVVIGILIALQLNGWKEERVEASLEIGIVTSLLEDISENEVKLKDMMEGDSVIYERNKALLQILQDEKSEYHDSLKLYFGTINRYNIFFPQRIAYQDLVSKGLHIMKNDSMRNKVIELFDVTYLLASHMVALKRDLYINSNDIFNKRLYTPESISHKIPTDFMALKSDQEFINNLSHITGEGRNFLSHARSIIESNNSVKKLTHEKTRISDNPIKHNIILTC